MVTRWPGSQEVGGTTPAATKIVRCNKKLAFNIGEARKPRKAVGPMYIGRVIPEHVKDPGADINTRHQWSETRITKNSCKAT